MMQDFNYIQEEIAATPVVLFMKGTKAHPYCGFSRTVVSILQALDVSFKDVDVLHHQTLREDLKRFSQWPTFPQLYINGVFIGGCDIVKSMMEDGTLQPLVQPYLIQ